MDILDSFRKFLEDPDGWEFYITGQAGTGKTTILRKFKEICIELNKTSIACAHTHKACNILRSKLPEGAIVLTTHAYIKKRPGTNDNATKIEHLSFNSKTGMPDHIDIVFIDEYSMLGEADYADLGLIQDPEGEGEPVTKIVYIGDPNQLPPIGDIQAVNPCGKYKHTLTKVYRQEGGNQLLDTLTQLVTYIEGAKPEPLKEHDTFIRGTDIIKEHAALFANGLDLDKMAMLAYTNERVQSLNAMIAGKEEPDIDEELFSPTLRQYYSLSAIIPSTAVSYIFLPFGDPIGLGAKYKPLEHLIGMECCDFYNLSSEGGEIETWAVVFGHYNYKIALENYGKTAVEANQAIEELSDGIKAKEWAFNNKHHPLARKRAKAWRDYITFKNCVICIDFPFAMTVHKSQGSTFDTVFIDTQDLSICANKDYNMYLRLLYVAISRASRMVYTN